MAALVAVVYVTLLRPEGPSTITGIEAPNGGAIPRIEAHERPGKPPHSAKEGGRPRPSGRGTGAVGAAGVVTATGVVQPGGAAASPQTPPGDQYTDAVKALLDRVSAARVPGQ